MTNHEPPVGAHRREAPVLVLRALGLGDAITGIPALRGVRRRFPGRRIVLAGSDPIAGWLQRQGLCDEVLDVRGWVDRAPDDRDEPPGHRLGRHLAVNLHGRGPESHRLLLRGDPDELIAFDCADAGFHSGVPWRLDEHEVDRWCRLVGHCDREDLRLKQPAHRDGPVVIHPGAGSAARRWPVERWAEVAQVFHQPVVVTGGPGEQEICRRLAAMCPGAQDLSGVLDLDGLVELVSQARLVLSADTGVAHLATAYATPSVVLFGPMPPEWWGPAIDPELHAVVYKAKPGYRGDEHAGDPDPALLAVEPPDVIEPALKLVS